MMVMMMMAVVEVVSDGDGNGALVCFCVCVFWVLFGVLNCPSSVTNVPTVVLL